jgi:TrmH family RNA methyltransferase
MGTVFQLPVLETENLASALQTLRSGGFRIMAAHPHAREKTLWHANFPSNCVIVFGSEGYGISANILGVCDETLTVPMPPNVDSLNVASAAAVFLYEAARQRSKNT